MTSALATAFPSSVSYGSASVNWMPVHRDFLAFDTYYRGASMAASLDTANTVLRNNAAGGAPRTYATYPTVLGKGCWTVFDFWGISYTYCETRTQALGSMYVSKDMIEGSVGRLVVGPTGNAYQSISSY